MSSYQNQRGVSPRPAVVAQRPPQGSGVKPAASPPPPTPNAEKTLVGKKVRLVLVDSDEAYDGKVLEVTRYTYLIEMHPDVRRLQYKHGISYIEYDVT